MQVEAQDIQQSKTTLMKGIKENAGMAIFVGVLLIIMGMLAIATPFIMGVSVVLLVGGVLVGSGIFQLLFAFKSKGGLLVYLMAILNVFIGGYMLINPAIALETLTLFVAIYLIITGMSEVFIACKARGHAGRGWALFSAFMSIVLGFMIWLQFPFSGLWTIGLLVGIKLLFTGWTLLMFGLLARRVIKEKSNMSI